MKLFRSLYFKTSMIVFGVFILTTGLFDGIFFLLRFLHIMPYNEVPPLWSAVVTILVCNLLGAVAASVISAYFIKPVDEMTDALEQISKGDFDVHLKTDRGDAHIRELKETINKTAEELGSIEVMRNDFINTISHEFKTPVSSIIGYAGRLKNENITKERQAEYADIIIEESRHLSNITTNILLLTKFENTEIITNKKLYSLDEQIRRCVSLLSQSWIDKGINMEGNFSQVDFYGNEELVNLIWTNLIDNAIKHTDIGGSIFCSVDSNKSSVIVTVRDSGCGMSEETQKHIFDKFYQADESRKSGGNGLGLSIVKRLVDLCRGEITVKSELGKGTEFTVILPNEKAA